MKWQILHQSRGRLRVHLCTPHITLRQADIVEYYLRGIPGVTDVQVFDRTRDAVIRYEETTDRRDALVQALRAFTFATAEELATVPEHTARALNREFEDKLVACVLRRIGTKLFLPLPIRAALAVCRSLRYIREGLRSLLRGQLTVSVLDATAVTVSLLRGDFNTAGSVMFMLHLGELLEDWTHKKSVSDLAGAMSLNVDKVWLRIDDGQEVLVDVRTVTAGDRIIVRTGSMIPLDGRVVEGEASVNQASMTGEALRCTRPAGSYAMPAPWWKRARAS